jgi:cell fate regulator YaaT (PSP1 superfamily)
MSSSNKQNLHRDLAQTIARRKHLFELYQTYSNDDSSTNVHSQLQQTIRSHKAAMHHLYLKMQSDNSKQAA